MTEILKVKDKALFSKGRFYPKKIKIENVGSVLESSGQADSRTTSKIKFALWKHLESALHCLQIGILNLNPIWHEIFFGAFDMTISKWPQNCF